MNHLVTNSMNGFSYRYNRFSRSYLINYNDFEFEVGPDLFTILKSYYTTKDYTLTIKELSQKGITITHKELTELVSMIDNSSSTNEQLVKSRTFQVMDFSLFNTLLDHKKLMYSLFILLFLFTLINLKVFFTYLFLPRTNFYLFSNIIMIVPIYFLSRLIFTPVHEFGHYFFYYLFSGKSAKFYIQFPGFLYFMGITTTDDLFYIQNPFKRIIISLGGMLFELMFLIMILALFGNRVDPFYLQILSLRIFLSILFNVNFLSQSTDGHILLTDLIGFTTFSETYNEFIKSLLNRKLTPQVEIVKRVKMVFIIYTIVGFLFIGLLIYSQLLFLINILNIMLLPVTQNILGRNLGIVEIFLLVLTYLYYIDIFVRIYAKRVVLQKALQFRSDIGSTVKRSIKGKIDSVND